MTTFVLVHGAWHDAACWDAVVAALEAAGHVAIAPELPVSEPAAGFADYARVVAEAMPEADEPPVVVGHSLSSAVIAALPELIDVGLLVYLCPRLSGFRGPPGGPDVFRPAAGLPRDELDRTVWPRERAEAELYGRVEPALAHATAQRLRPQAQIWRAPHPAAVPPEVPSAMVVSSADEMFEPAWSRWAARNVLGVVPVERDWGHFPMLEAPRELAALLVELAREGGALPAPGTPAE
ncbi:alpha/beta hydrolase [Baekduia soli]|uniref:Alpha/beta hydrolase n=1 Tax=Baekduia soli TaxID=496014 RepID=A0A5B8U295_9ACTN|nr:alpha/beta hydrolase [Baekduia soli]QEC47081.1 alpha/beta hydrolase [Baekduia soli]